MRNPSLDTKGWLKRAKEPRVLQSIKGDPYCAVYPEMLAFFATFGGTPGGITWREALAGLHVVYGWMPTIPDLQRVVDLNPTTRAAVLKTLDNARGWLALCPSDAARILLEVQNFTNNSLVGASKLLHFLNPQVFPIWDSRVAKRFLRTFGRPTQPRMRDIRIWTRYYAEVHRWVKDASILAQLSEIRALSSNLAIVSPIRLAELVLFHPAPVYRSKDR